jgi:hypothetical protein
MLTARRLRELIDYDPDTGLLLWKDGSKVSGRRTIHIDGERYRTSRLAWLYMTGKWPKRFVIPVDGDKLNIRWSNLREASSAPNRLSRSNTSGYRGVSAFGKKWRAQIMIDGEQHHLGIFATQEEAAAAYASAAPYDAQAILTCGIGEASQRRSR